MSDKTDPKADDLRNEYSPTLTKESSNYDQIQDNQIVNNAINTGNVSEIHGRTINSPKLQHIFSSPLSVPIQGVSQPVGFITYNDTATTNGSFAVKLDFNKPEDFEISEAILYIRINPAIDPIAGTAIKVKKLHAYLNPTETLVLGSGGSGFYTTRFSGGTDLLTDYTPSSTTPETKTIILTETQILQIANGINSIGLQQNENDTDFNDAGYCSMNFVVTGYLVS